ncbi:hypothetical protein TRFO_38135 [Tritrichomonas foetus]|uniref:Vacuolar ATP synthase subunit E n=1 Tax=Tritrichomonas foetus TaxID=1144522 RepID=A0A1J4JDJ6_9EUKA|nr:hypothetical protein TRFO_38135 [Tritrichomonas foetus]|eukprot:OHS95747.1 hypothetical protein TRFO_38135 [Tritrichomonas foetus]
MAESRTSTQKGEIFALYQARLRAEEIDFEAREQYNHDFNNLINASYAKLNNDYELQKNEIDRQAKIQYSVTKNEQRILVLQSQQKIIEKAQNGTRSKLQKLHDSSDYEATLQKLILQGVKTLSEKEVRIHVIQKDVSVAKKCIQNLNGEFSQLGYSVQLDESEFLPDSSIGGCIVVNEKQTIRVDNSFEGRLQLATEGSLPKISQVLHKD